MFAKKLALPALFVVAALGCMSGSAEAAKASVTTYHNDNLRTGWNRNESVLTPSAVGGGSFGMIASASVDDEVDAQPLVVPNVTINGSAHDVVYVATASNTIYAFDATSGQKLLSNNFGAPVPYYDLPGGCGNNGPNIGINSTPVIDAKSNTMYAITYTLENGHQTFRIHALDIPTLADKIPSVIVSASALLANGQTYNFNPVVSRQRSALLLANGNIYAGFASFCDISADQSRGWVLGWNTGTLAPLAANHLNNTRSTAPDNFFLTSIWMSGYGLAASKAGDIYFVTGNSDYSGNTYDTQTNLSESVVGLSADLTTVQTYFSPTGTDNVNYLDRVDGDFGSGGVMLLPKQPGSKHHLAVAAGKAGILYLMNARRLGHQGHYLNTQNVGACWCGQSYFTGSDGVGRVVASGGSTVNVYAVQTQLQGNPTLVSQAATGITNGQDGGFFTSVSSNGTAGNSAVIWALGRPTDSNPAYIYLYALDPSGNILYSNGTAGTWPYTGGNANVVPTVANGRVYVASYQSLAIFGLGTRFVKLPPTKIVDTRVHLAIGEHEMYGIVRSMNGNMLTVAKRDGSLVKLDSTEAEKNSRMAEPSVGNGLIARGTIDANGMFHANIILHAKNNPAMWPSDR